MTQATLPQQLPQTLALPPHFAAADEVARHGKVLYRRLVAIGLSSITLASVAAVLATHEGHTGFIGAVAAAAAIIASIVCALWIAIERPEKAWYGGRAIAESVKTISWLYAMGAEPAIDAPQRDADAQFCARLTGLLKYSGQLDAPLTLDEHDVFITKSMRTLRAAPVQDRLALYLSARLDDQIRWYRREAAASNRGLRRWFLIAFGGQVLALVAAASAFWTSPERMVAIASALLTAAVSAAAWLQARRDQEQQQAYSFTVHELGLAHTLASYVTNDAELARFVMDSETAISREHTTWLARREQSRPAL